MLDNGISGLYFRSELKRVPYGISAMILHRREHLMSTNDGCNTQAKVSTNMKFSRELTA